MLPCGNITAINRIIQVNYSRTGTLLPFGQKLSQMFPLGNYLGLNLRLMRLMPGGGRGRLNLEAFDFRSLNFWGAIGFLLLLVFTPKGFANHFEALRWARVLLVPARPVRTAPASRLSWRVPPMRSGSNATTRRKHPPADSDNGTRWRGGWRDAWTGAETKHPSSASGLTPFPASC